MVRLLVQPLSVHFILICCLKLITNQPSVLVEEVMLNELTFLGSSGESSGENEDNRTTTVQSPTAESSVTSNPSAATTDRSESTTGFTTSPYGAAPDRVVAVVNWTVDSNPTSIFQSLPDKLYARCYNDSSCFVLNSRHKRSVEEGDDFNGTHTVVYTGMDVNLISSSASVEYYVIFHFTSASGNGKYGIGHQLGVKSEVVANETAELANVLSVTTQSSVTQNGPLTTPLPSNSDGNIYMTLTWVFVGLSVLLLAIMAVGLAYLLTLRKSKETDAETFKLEQITLPTTSSARNSIRLTSNSRTEEIVKAYSAQGYEVKQTNF